MSINDLTGERVSGGRLVAVLLALFLLSVLVRLPNISGNLDPDSADYVQAARRGYWVNALDLNSRPIRSFVSDCAKIFLFQTEVHVWATDRENDDIAAFRHYHAPLFHILLSFWISLFGTSNAALAMLPVLMGSLMAPVVFWAWRRLFPEQSIFPGLAAGLFVALNLLLSNTSKFVTFHPLFTLMKFLVLVFLACALRDRRTRDLYVSAALLGACFATLEYAVLLLACCALALLLVKNPWVSVTRQGISIAPAVLWAVVIMFAVFLALWPAGVLKLSALKGYIVLCGLYGGSEWETPLRVVLRDFFCESPVLMVFCLVGLVLGVHRVFSRKAPGWILPLVLFPTVIFISNLRNAIAKPAYLALIVPCLALLAGWALWTVAERTVRRPVILLAAVMVVCAAVNGPRLLAAGVHGLYIWPQVIQFFDERANAGDSVLVSNNIESKVLAHYEPKLAVCHGHRWALALQQTTERILRGDYRFLMLIGYPARSDPGRPYEKPVSDLPYYNIVKDRYDLVEVLKRGPDDVIVELYERRKSR